MKKKKKRSRIQKPIIDGIKFDSGLEGSIYEAIRDNKLGKLTDIEELNNIKILSYQPDKYVVIKGFKAGLKSFRDIVYTPDFVIEKDGKEIILEVKSSWSAKKPDYRLRMKLFLSQYKDKINFAELTMYNKKKYEYIEYF